MNVYLCKTNGRQLRTLSPVNLARIVSAQAAAASPISSRASISGLPAPGPVLTFLSPNPQFSQSATQVLNQLFDFPTLYLNEVKGGGNMGRDGRARDHLDKLHFGDSNEANVTKWDSKACICPSSGTILHLLSLSTNGDCETESHHSYHSQEVSSKHKLSLISVYGGENPSDLLAETEAIQSTNEESYREVILEARKRLAKAMQSQQFFSSSESVGENEDSNSNSTSFASTLESRLRGLLFQFLHSIGKQAHGSLILSQNPLSSRSISTIIDLDSLQINGNRDELMQQIEFTVENSPPKSKLRELALPFFPEHSNFTAEFSRSSLLRPLPGLYQSYAMNSHLEQSTKDCPPKTRRNINSNPGLIFRPLPAATEDMRLPPPSLVFQCQSLTETQAFLEGTLGGRTAKIGWRGDGAGGSLMIFHPALSGIDIRISSGNENGDWILSSYFDEAQESLLAGSLDELQSAHVVSDGGSKSDTQNELILERDSKIGNADCWVEVRANVKHPTGFWKQFSPGAMWNKITGKKKNTVNVAKPPDLPYD